MRSAGRSDWRGNMDGAERASERVRHRRGGAAEAKLAWLGGRLGAGRAVNGEWIRLPSLAGTRLSALLHSISRGFVMSERERLALLRN